MYLLPERIRVIKYRGHCMRHAEPLDAAKMLAQEYQLRVRPDRQLLDGIWRPVPGLAGLVLLLLAGPAAAVDEGWFFLRTHNPFLQIYGLPPFQTASLATGGEVQYRTTFDIANHADSSNSQGETVTIDGESYFFTLSMRRGVTKWLELGFDLPLVWHSSGVFDNAIERWHKIWGLSNSERTRPSNELLFRYERDGASLYELSAPVSGPGDLQLTAAVPLKRKDGIDGYAVSLRSSLKLPTGDEKELLGSGATDFSLGLYASRTGIFSWPDLSVSGFAGILWLGKGELFTDVQERTVAFGGVAGAWRATDRLSIAAQVYAQDNYLKSALNDIGGKTVQATFGGTYNFPDQAVSLSLALVEDLVTDTVSDVALHLSVRWQGGERRAASR